MNDHARKVILKHFCERHTIPQIAVNSVLGDIVCATAAPYLLMIECLDQLDPTNLVAGILVKLVDRTYRTAAASLVLVRLSHVREAEVLARTVFESAITIAYIVHETPAERISAFFQRYIEQERTELRKWRSELEGKPQRLRLAHLPRIKQKDLVLNRLDQTIAELRKFLHLSNSKSKHWPNIMERVAELGEEHRLEYRTVYSAMCSQAHHDAEDIISYFVVNSIDSNEDMALRLENETNLFSVLMVLFALRSFVKATRTTCEWLQFPTVVAEALLSEKRLERELDLVGESIEHSIVPKHWASVIDR